MRRFTKYQIFFLFSLLLYSCADHDGLVQNEVDAVVGIDSIVVQSSSVLNLTACDTIKIGIRVYPKAATFDDYLITSHQVFLSRVVKDAALNGGGKFEPSEYKIIQIKKVEAEQSDFNAYNLFITDTDDGHGYRDTVQICVCGNDKSFVSSNPFKIQNCGTELTNFALVDGISIYDSFCVKNDTIKIQIPNSFDLTKSVARFKHNGKDVYASGIKQKSGESVIDFSDFCTPKEYIVKGFDGDERKYTIELFNLPIVFVNTPASVDITSRYEWLEKCTFSIRDTNGIIEDYGEANVKGRGNWSWRVGSMTGKKPLNIKLANKPKDRNILGMPGHKRWVLLANPMDYLANPIGFEVNRRTESCKWSPRCRFVELFINERHIGLYLLTEHIRIDKNRIDIKELKKTDIDGDAVTGGYLISYDDADEDSDMKFYTQYYNMPVMIKNPDEDDIVPQQQEYIHHYINDMEESLFVDNRFQNQDYEDYLDIDTWVDYFFLEELWGSFEMWRPRSVWMFKNRNGKICAGPGWDYENSYFDKQELMCKDNLYFGRLFQDQHFVARVKNRWPYFYSNLIGNEKTTSIINYIDSLYTVVKLPAKRDRMMYPSAIPDRQINLDTEYAQIKDGILQKAEWLGTQIMSW